MREPVATKLFVGQVPRDWSETELRGLFEKYGDIYSLTILKDKATGQHKGCAFLIYYDNESAKKAAQDLHEKKTLPGSKHPIQVKPAESEVKEEERKLFVGMISKNIDENKLLSMFSPHGTIEDLKILKTPDGKSKGCAFIKFETKLSAQNAIKKMHNCLTMEGCNAPIVVKLADTDKDKLNKRMQMQIGGQGTAGIVSAINPLQQATYQQLLAQMAMPNPQLTAQLLSNANLISNPSAAIPGTMGALVATLVTQQQQIQQQQSQQQQPPQQSSHQSSIYNSPQQPDYSNTQTSGTGLGVSLPANYANLGIGSYGTPGSNAAVAGGISSAYSSLPQYGSTSYQAIPTITSGSGSTASSSTNPSENYYNIAQYAGSMLPQIGLSSLQTGIGLQQQQSKKEGPSGANLFIYHLPPEFRDADLMQMFMPFGNVISAKVYIDKVTQLSKCFGFVSFDNASSASQAIGTMNGFVIGSKRLKVQLKLKKEQSKPY